VCVRERGGEGGRGREGERARDRKRERERVCVCACVCSVRVSGCVWQEGYLVSSEIKGMCLMVVGSIGDAQGFAQLHPHMTQLHAHMTQLHPQMTQRSCASIYHKCVCGRGGGEEGRCR
jgi:hypothetical protein